MPYITQADRDYYNDLVNKLIDLIEVNGGESGHLNYVISRLVLAAFGWRANYVQANMVVGVLEAAKLEFYRRTVAPYEDKKIEENGDLPR